MSAPWPSVGTLSAPGLIHTQCCWGLRGGPQGPEPRPLGMLPSALQRRRGKLNGAQPPSREQKWRDAEGPQACDSLTPEGGLLVGEVPGVKSASLGGRCSQHLARRRQMSPGKPPGPCVVTGVWLGLLTPHCESCRVGAGSSPVCGSPGFSALPHLKSEGPFNRTATQDHS